MGDTSLKIGQRSQRLIQIKSAVASASGTATFTFDVTPLGYAWTGSISCTGAPNGAVFSATANGISWGSWGANTVFGPIQTRDNEVLVVTVTGLTSGTTYQLTWVGSSDPSDAVAAIWPEANSSALTASITGSVMALPSSTQLYTNNYLALSGSSPVFSQKLNLPAGCASLLVSMSIGYPLPTFPTGGLYFSVYGVASNTEYCNFSLVPSQFISNSYIYNSVFIFPIEVPYGADTSVYFQISGPLSGSWAVTFEPLTILSSTLSFGTMTVLNAPGTTLAVNGTVTTAAESATAATAPTEAIEVGGIAQVGTTLPTAVTDGQLVGEMADKFGRQVMIPQTVRELTAMQATTFTASTSSATVVTAGSSGIYNDITSIILVNSGSTATTFLLKDGTNTYEFYVPAGDMRGATFTVPLAAASAATAWTGQCGSSTSSLICTITYVKNQ
jgi:hypothetical protein